jgi:TonB-dependent receptor
LFAQKKSVLLSGKILEAGSNTPVVGASVIATPEGSTTKSGTHTDVEGRFFLNLEPNRKYTIALSNIGFASKKLDDIETSGNDLAPLNITLEKANAELTTVVVTASAKREAIASIYSAQKNAPSISDGISAEVIRKSPDRNTGDVLKRVSGASVQDNKFVVIRGLSERYNVSLLNNSVLPSTEADKKAFAFDIIPSSIVDNLVISKSASPDLPGDFSGGAIKIFTKDYPSKKISELSVSIGYNSLTTGKNFYNGFPNGSLDKLGFFDDSRLIPGPYYRNKTGFISQSPEFQKEVTKLFPNNYGWEAVNKSMPNLGISYTGGNTKLFKNGNKLGHIYNVGYGIGRAVSDRDRSESDITKRNIYNYNTINYDQKNNLTALLNLTYSYRKSKISFKNIFNNTFVKTLGLRDGANYENGEESVFHVKSDNSEATQNGLFNSVLEGLHKINNNFSVDWTGSFGYTYRNQPDQRILTFRTPDNVTDQYYIKLNNKNSPEIRNAGRVYSFLGEYIYGLSANATQQFKLFGQTQKFKFGTMNYYRDRNVEVEALGYATLNSNGVPINESKTTTFDNIFSPGNIDLYNLTVANIQTNSTNYNGTAMLNAGYFMLDNKFTDKLRMTWGFRVEKYRQELNTVGRPSKVYDNTDVLPSLLLTYGLTDKTNLRLGGSMAVNRPEFRELADYSVFDYDTYLAIRGNPDLVRARNTNADLRYEWFPAAGGIVSASVFYKYFQDPIEQVNKGNDVLSYENADHATAYGVELEVRKKLDFIGGNFFNDLAFYANAAFIKGSVQFGGLSYNSPLQGQSPYLINGGLNYTHKGFSVNALYNRIGPRLRFRAVEGAALSIFERPRDVIDLQISKSIMHNKLELRLTASDLLAQANTWYYKYDSNPSNLNYKASEDKIINSMKFGTTTTLALKYNFGR